MYGRAWDAFRDSIGLFAGAALLFTLSTNALPPHANLGADIILAGLLAFFCFRMILLGEHHPWIGMFAHSKPPNVTLGPFLARFAILACLAIATDITLRLMVMTPDLGGLTLLIILVVGGVLALIGTLLPATCIAADPSLSAAFGRGRTLFWRTLWRLTYGPLLFATLTTVIETALTHVILNMALSGTLGQFGLILGIRSLEFCTALALGFTILLTATCLSLAYQSGPNR